ncbi:hypothetical protein [Microcoleus sp. CAWBG640]
MEKIKVFNGVAAIRQIWVDKCDRPTKPLSTKVRSPHRVFMTP